jgi:hypothetical protein
MKEGLTSQTMSSWIFFRTWMRVLNLTRPNVLLLKLEEDLKASFVRWIVRRGDGYSGFLPIVLVGELWLVFFVRDQCEC